MSPSEVVAAFVATLVIANVVAFLVGAGLSQ
jgi:hypothetical protein